MTRSGVTVLVKQSIYSSFSTKHPDFISSDLCPPNSPVDHRIWRLKQECVYIVQDTCPWHLRLDAVHHWHMGKHHRLRGSASTVLTATGQVNAWVMANFDPSQNRNPWLRKNSAQLIRSVTGCPKPNLVQIHPLGLLGKWVKYAVLCLIIYYLYHFFLSFA